MVGQLTDIAVFARLRRLRAWWVAPAASTIPRNQVDHQTPGAGIVGRCARRGGAPNASRRRGDPVLTDGRPADGGLLGQARAPYLSWNSRNAAYARGP